MYQCQLESCNKAYNTQHALTRHKHNHRKTTEYLCPSCQVIFYRKDLLTRHAKIHNPVNSGSQGSRQRCHTACINCREARIKCDSNKPCESCSNLGKNCIFSFKSNRVSTNTRYKNYQNSETEESFTSHVDAPSQGALSGSFDSTETRTITGANDEMAIVSRNPLNPMQIIDFTDLSPSQMTAWPWLHENLFLQQEYGAGWVGYQPNFFDAQALPGSFVNVTQDVNAGNSIEHVPQGSGQESFLTNGSKSHSTAPINGWDPSLSQAGNQFATSAPQDTEAVPFQDKENPGRISNLQMNVICDLVAYARKTSLEPPSRGGRLTYWHSISMRVQEAFELDCPQVGYTNHCLMHLLQLYWDNFWTLWPLFPQHSFDANYISPVLYLVLSSIGAMYGGSKSSHYGVLMHEALREYLCEPLLGSEESDTSSLSLAHARLLTQVAALYFGQKRAFSYAQHLSSVLIAQTRRMDLYATSRHCNILSQIPMSLEESSENRKWLARWLLAESRKRLAFGILRAEVYTSLIMNTRPLLCSEEVELELPCSNFLWQTKFASNAQFIAAIRQDAVSSSFEKLPFSDIVRIAMERNEKSPPLNMISQELLIFGLQEHVWRLYHDPDTFARLIGTQTDLDIIYDGLDEISTASERSPNTASSSFGPGRSSSMLYTLESRISGHQRQMNGLRSDRRKTAWALGNWRMSLNATRGRELTRSDRTSLMSSLLLFHISFLRIFAPIEKLHHISYRVGSEKSAEADIIRDAWTWSRTDQSRIAAQHACIIWSLLFQECAQADGTRAHFNFLALLGLHHAAVVIWTYAGTHDESSADSTDLSFGSGESIENKVPVVSPMSRELMTMFVRLYSRISPAWSVRSSFSAATVRLAHNEFPLQPE